MELTTVRRHCFNVDDYHAMVEAGVLREDDRVELIRGEVVEMVPIGSPHVACVARLNRWLVQCAGDRAIVSVQGPVRLSRVSEPQPDLVLLKARSDFYESALPAPQDVLLAIEVADTSLHYDREVKVPLYAESGIPELWIVDLAGRGVEVYSKPEANRYGTLLRVAQDEALQVAALPECRIKVSEILGL